MKIQIKFFILGFISAGVLGLGSIVGFLYLFESHHTPTFHDQALPSGRSVKITMCNLAWGMEHDERFPEKDGFLLEYVSSVPDADQQVKDQETVEVFELIRPISELWGIDKAEIHGFPSTKRKGAYDIYYFKRNPNGKWTFDREAAKVFIND